MYVEAFCWNQLAVLLEPQCQEVRISTHTGRKVAAERKLKKIVAFNHSISEDVCKFSCTLRTKVGCHRVAKANWGNCNFCISSQMHNSESLCVSYGSLILILPCLLQSEVSWLDWKNTLCLSHMQSHNIDHYIPQICGADLQPSTSLHTVLHVPRLPSTHSLPSAPSSIIKARNSLAGCRVLCFQFSFDILPKLKTLLQILQRFISENLLTRGEEVIFCVSMCSEKGLGCIVFTASTKVLGSRVLTEVSL